MSKKKTTDKFKQEVYDLVGNEYSVLGEYHYAIEKILFKHNTCNQEFYMQPSNFLSGQRCPLCRYKRSAKSNSKTNDDFKKEIYMLVKDEYYAKTEYKGIHEKVLFHHNKCNSDFWMEANLFINSGCRCTNKQCIHERMSASMKDTQNEFDKKFNLKSNGKFELLSKYKSSYEKIKIKHLECGHIFETTPNYFLSNTGCPKCNYENLLKRLTKPIEDFQKSLFDIHGNNISLVGNYINMYTKCDFICNICGNVWSAAPLNVTHKTNPTGCPNCKRSKGERKIYIFLNKNNIENIQQKKFDGLVGIGNNPLSFDFWIPLNNILIEFQGKQHYEPVEVFGGQKSFDIQQEHDKRKRNYAKDHNIKLLEIPYWDYENIENILSKELNLVS